MNAAAETRLSPGCHPVTPADRPRYTNVVGSRPLSDGNELTRSTGMAAYIAHSRSQQSGLSTDQKDGNYDGSGRNNMG
jgi:hypothetical protein